MNKLDQKVAEAIRTLLKQDEALAPVSQDVHVQVAKGVVTLRGTVPKEAAKSQIIQRIDQLPGVDRIADRLEVTPAPG
ncbi:MAG TPA: BON domain-containing protein [Candidatus Sulfotelmatobacter sp.]|nr:BON domain-containing protein [Candidatus Sulfotelmatobacter sp.]